jgi:hypothetical protein
MCFNRVRELISYTGYVGLWKRRVKEMISAITPEEWFKLDDCALGMELITSTFATNVCFEILLDVMTHLLVYSSSRALLWFYIELKNSYYMIFKYCTILCFSLSYFFGTATVDLFTARGIITIAPLTNPSLAVVVRCCQSKRTPIVLW